MFALKWRHSSTNNHVKLKITIKCSNDRAHFTFLFEIDFDGPSFSRRTHKLFSYNKSFEKSKSLWTNFHYVRSFVYLMNLFLSKSVKPFMNKLRTFWVFSLYQKIIWHNADIKGGKKEHIWIAKWKSILPIKFVIK